MKKLLGVLLVTVMALFGFAACTDGNSNSSGVGSSDTNLHPLASSAEWKSGKRFASGASQTTVADWINTLDLNL